MNYEKNGATRFAILALSDQVENYVIADEDEFGTAVAAPVATERWTGEEYIVGAGSTSTGDINTTTADKAYVGALPGGAAPTGYWLRQKVSRKARFYSAVIDMTITFDTPIVADSYGGLFITKGTAYDANNHLFIVRRQNSAPGNDDILIDGMLGGVAVTPITVAVSAASVALKVERFNNIWVFFYSTSMHPNYVWTFAGQLEDTANDMTSVTSIALGAYSSGTLANDVEIDFDYFAYYISSQALFQAIANGYDSSHVAADRDGDLLQRTEYIIEALDAESLLVTDWSQSGPVEEDALEEFAIYLYDKRAGAIALADIDISAISQVIEQSRGGGAFSAVGITQPTFAKANGVVDDQYRFLLAEWQVGDMYKLTVSGITATIDGEVLPIQAITWCNVVHEALNIDTYVKANSFLDGVWVDATLGTAGTTYPIGTPPTPVAGLADALTIATARKVSKIYLVQGAHALPAGTWSNFQFIGTSPGVSLDLANRTCANAQFTNLTLSGILLSTAHIVDCTVNISCVASTNFTRSHIIAVQVDTDSITIRMDDCTYDATIDFDSLIAEFNLAHASGYIQLVNMADAGSEFNAQCDSLFINIGASNTAGTANLYGTKYLTGAGGGCTINNFLESAINTKFAIARHKTHQESAQTARVVSLAFSNAAADKVFAPVTFPANKIPANATITGMWLWLKWRKMVESSGLANAINAAAKSIRIMDSAGAWGTDDIIAITMANGAWDMAASAVEPPDFIMGTIDLSGTYSTPALINGKTFLIWSEQTNRTDAITVTGASITLYDQDSIIVVEYTV